MLLIGVSGKKGVGKDSLCDVLVNRYGFLKLSFAQELKAQVRDQFGLTKEHTDGALKELPTNFASGTICSTSLVPSYWTPREIMVEYGQFFRQFDPLWWVRKTFDKVRLLETFDRRPLRVCISDVRFKNEANYIKEQDGIVVRLNRKPELNIYKTPSTDLSEIDLDNYQGFDVELPEDENIDLKDLGRFADTIMKYAEVQGVGNSR